MNHELAEAARLNRAPEEVLQRLLEGETEARGARAVEKRLKAARLPGVKTLDGFDWRWPEEINRDHVRHLFTLAFMRTAANVIFIGGVGVGKTHLATALAREACLHNCCIHVTHRCYRREFLLGYDLDRRLYRNRLFQAARRFPAIRVLNYIITSNHVHLLVLLGNL